MKLERNAIRALTSLRCFEPVPFCTCSIISEPLRPEQFFLLPYVGVR